MGLFEKISLGERLFKWCMNGNPFDINPLIETSQLEPLLLIIGCLQDKGSKFQEASDLFKEQIKVIIKYLLKMKSQLTYQLLLKLHHNSE